MAKQKHLWEIDHPYYRTEGCYFSNECHQEHESFDSFLEEWKDSDLDYNWLIRWDWIDKSKSENRSDDDDTQDVLEIQFFIQRKAYPLSVDVKVDRKDEDRVRAWLQKYVKYMVKMWQPFLEAK
jgi:hypothetical protein